MMTLEWGLTIAMAASAIGLALMYHLWRERRWARQRAAEEAASKAAE